MSVTHVEATQHVPSELLNIRALKSLTMGSLQIERISGQPLSILSHAGNQEFLRYPWSQASPRFDLPFAFIIIHGIRRSTKIRQSSTPMYYCEHKQKVKVGEAWERG